jgi:hypothetical protein
MFAAVEKIRQAQDDPVISEQRQEIYRAIGEAITEWSLVEDRLAVLFAYFVAGTASAVRRAKPAMAAFHIVINFQLEARYGSPGGSLVPCRRSP